MPKNDERLLEMLGLTADPGWDHAEYERRQMDFLSRRYGLRMVGTNQSAHATQKELARAETAIYAGLAGPCLVCGVANPKTGISVSHMNTLATPNDPELLRAHNMRLRDAQTTFTSGEFTAIKYNQFLSAVFPPEVVARLMEEEVRKNLTLFDDKRLGTDVQGTAVYLGGVHYLQPAGIKQVLNASRGVLGKLGYPNMPIIHRLGEVTGLMYGTPSHERFKGTGFMDIGQYHSEPPVAGTIWRG